MGRLVQYLYGIYFNEGSGAKIDEDLVRDLSVNPIGEDQGNSVEKVKTIETRLFQSQYIRWVDKKISMGIISSNRDFISTRFGGCYMAAYTGEDGLRRGFHIHKGECDQGQNWNGIIDCLESHQNRPYYTQGILFQPNPYFDRKEELRINLGIDLWHLNIRLARIQTWGIISTCKECHSILVYKDNDDIWKIDRMEKTSCIPNMRIRCN